MSVLAGYHGLDPSELTGSVYVHREAEVAHHLAATSAEASIELVRQRLGTLTQSTVLLIGAGTTGELAAKHLIKHRPRELLILGRGSARAMRLAERYGGRALTSEQLGAALTRSDVVISSTSAPHTIVRAEVARFTRWLSRRERAADLRSLSTAVERARAAAL